MKYSNKAFLRPLAAVLAVAMLAIGCGAVKPVHAETQTSAMLANAIGLDGQEITITSIDEDLPSGICDDGSVIVNLNDAEDGQPFVIGAASDGLCSDSDTMPTVQPNGFIAPIDEPPVEGSIAISTAKQLYDIRSNSTGNYHLENDIDVSDLAELDITWAMLPSYNGIFDGQGHTIYGLNDPLFYKAEGTIKNLGVDVNINRNYTCFGAIVCEASGNISFDNCTTHGTITFRVIGTYGELSGGGLLGYNHSYIVSMVNCINNINIEGNYSGKSDCELGGMAGRLELYKNPDDSAFENVINNGSITLTCAGNVTSVAAGGIIGGRGRFSIYNYPPMLNVRYAINYGNIITSVMTENETPASASAGGITGVDGTGEGRYENCANYGIVSAQADGGACSGGIVGGECDRNSITRCSSFGRIEALSASKNAFAGGIIGRYSDINDYTISVSECSVPGIVHAETQGSEKFAYSGGIIGYSEKKPTLSHCLCNYSAGAAVDDWHVYAGGLIGYAANGVELISNCAYRDINDFCGYYDSTVSSGIEHAHAYSGELITENANYLIRVLDDRTFKPVPGAAVSCDGITGTTDNEGNVRLTLPYNVVLELLVSKELYASKQTDGVRLEPGEVCSIYIHYEGNTASPGSSPNPGSGSGGGVNIGGTDIGFRLPSAGDIECSGPETVIRGKSSPAFKIKFGLSLPPNLTPQVKVDPDKQTVEIIYGFDTSSNFDETRDKIKNLLAKAKNGQLTMKDVSFVPAESGKLVDEGSFRMFGYIKLNYYYKDGEMKYTPIDGGLGLAFESNTKYPKIPFWAICYFQVSVKAEAEGKLVLGYNEDNNSVVVTGGSIEPELSISGKIGASLLSGLLKAEGGITAKGKATFDFPWSSWKDSFSAAASIELFVKVKAVLFEAKHSWKFPDWEIYPRSKDDLTINLDDYLCSEAMQLIPRDYNNGNCGIAEAGNDSFTLNNVFPYGEPQLVQLSDGRMLMVWVHDDGSRSDENRTALYYSIYNGDSWSEPRIVRDDGTGDFSPRLASDGSNVYLVWQNCTQIYESGVTLETMLETTELCFSRFTTSGTFTAPTVIDDAGRYQSEIDIAANNGEVTVVWKENSANDLWGDEGTYSIFRKKYSDYEWGTTTACVSGKPIIYDVKVGYVNDAATIAYLLDLDGDTGTTDDIEVYKYVGSSTTRVTNNSVCDDRIQFCSGTLYWFSNGELRNTAGTLELTSEEEVRLIADANGSIVAVFKYAIDGFNTELYAARYNSESQEWTTAAPITAYKAAVRSFCPVVGSDGTISVAMNTSELLEIHNDDDDPYGDTALRVVIGSTLTDLMLTDGIFYNMEDVTPGESILLSTSVYNNSGSAVEGLVAKLYNAEGELVSETAIEDSIASGEEKEVMFSYTIPAELTKHELTVSVLPANVTDDDLSNNSASVTFGYADITVIDENITENESGGIFTATVTNAGYDTAENVTANLMSADGIDLGTIEIGTLAVGESCSISFDIPSECMASADESDYKTFTVTASTSSQESCAYNNSAIAANSPVRVESVSLDITNKQLVIGENVQLTASIAPAEAVNQLVLWTSSNVDVAVVDESGLVTAIGKGNCTIYATSDDGTKVAACEIVVTDELFTVTFVDWDDTVIDIQIVEKGSAAAAPADPVREGYNFIGWDKEFSAVMSDLVVYAMYEPAAIPGDISGDGVVNASDAILVMRYILGFAELSPEQVLLSDIDGNGAVNATDAMLIMRMVLNPNA